MTLIEFVLEPAAYIGEAIKKLMIAAFEDLPVFLWLPVYIFIIIFIVMILLILSGYRLRTLLFSIEPHRPEVQYIELPRHDEVLPLRDDRPQV